MLDFVFRAHLRLAFHAALLFAVGVFLSWAVVHYRLRIVAWPAVQAFRLIMRLIGRSPSLLRMAGAIFAFNVTVMFIYMASGFHPFLPKLFGIWTGMNVGIGLSLARETRIEERARPKGRQWRPPRLLAEACGVTVLVLELPCFWYAVAMGISMGHAVQMGAEPYVSALGVRATAYGEVIAPLLLCSAMAEAIAIRGSAAEPTSP